MSITVIYRINVVIKRVEGKFVDSFTVPIAVTKRKMKVQSSLNPAFNFLLRKKMGHFVSVLPNALKIVIDGNILAS